MMLHRHFEAQREERNENITTLKDVSPEPVNEQEPEEHVEETKKRTRSRKTTEA